MATSVDKIVKVGQLVRLRLLEDGDARPTGLRVDDQPGWFSSRIDDATPEYVAVAWPTDRGVLVPVMVGQGVSLVLSHQRGRLMLTSRIVGVAREPFPVLRIAHDGQWSTAQLRQNVRLNVTIQPLETLLLSTGAVSQTRDVSSASGAGTDMNAIGTSRQAIRVTMQDLSAGGTRITSTTPLKIGDIIQLTFPLERGKQEISARAKVVWAKDDHGTGKRRVTEAGCQFVEMGAREQDRITKFIFSKQAELRRRGLL